ncbi:hypothetical protein FCM35_KLT06445 [Carex littledalei]|uniref:Uncharacterized protein n=1 Tax=Carex littledalei TaxID=544730 RepID=A0A833VLI3_9POAL|nr:hypothetical protein FCM35_KLT06445 [Carex littledalei]
MRVWGGTNPCDVGLDLSGSWLVAARPLCHLQCPVTYLSRLQNSARRPCEIDLQGGRPRLVRRGGLADGTGPSGPKPLLWVGRDGERWRLRIPLVRTSSESAVRCPGKAPEGAVPDPSPDRHAATRSRRVSSSSSPPAADGFGAGTPCPALRANPFPEVTDPFCRLPLPTLFHRPEAVHLGDLMQL